MRRSTVTTAIALIALALGGCSNGLKEGMPTDVTETPRPPDSVNKHMLEHAKQIRAGKISHRPTSNRPSGR